MKNIDKIIKILRNETKNLNKTAMNTVENSDSYKILVSCLLSLRTRDQITIKATQNLFSLASNPYDMINIGIDKIEKSIKSVNYYKTKAKRIIEISKELIAKYDGKVPNNFNELIKLKGVGRKTANIVLTHAFGKDAIAVDTHVHRISNRIGIVRTKTPEQTEIELEKKIPKKYWKEYNEFLVLWGQNICLPIRPKCSDCKINEFCQKIGVFQSR